MSKNSTEVGRKPLGASNKKPIVLSSSKYKKIIHTIHADEERKKEADDEQRYKEYLKNGSDEMVSKWTTNLRRTQEQKLAERKEKFAQRALIESLEFKKICAKDEQIRQAKIAKAQELIQKLKPGPKELQSAAIQSETMKTRAVQRNITKEFEESLNKHTAEEQFQMERQAMPWIEEEQRRVSANIQRQNQYKQEILSTINEKARKKAENAKAELAEHKIAQEILDEEMKAQIEKEKDMLNRKRETLRKNALEAMIMVEQRKAREQVYDTVEGNLLAVYCDGKRTIDQIRKDRDIKAHQEKMHRNSINAQNLTAMTKDNTEAEEERLRKDISTIQLQFTAQEKEKIQRSRQQKLARIQEYFRELSAQKEKKHRKLEEVRLAMANRLKNEEVNAAFDKKLKEDQMKKSQEFIKGLDEQMEERKQTEAAVKELDNKCYGISFDKEDKFFFDYADKLVSVANENDRPLYPFVKAIQNYKKENGIDQDQKLPPHLESNLRIGMKTPPPADNAACSPDPNVRKYGLDELKDLNPYSPRDVCK